MNAAILAEVPVSSCMAVVEITQSFARGWTKQLEVRSWILWADVCVAKLGAKGAVAATGGNPTGFDGYGVLDESTARLIL